MCARKTPLFGGRRVGAGRAGQIGGMAGIYLPFSRSQRPESVWVIVPGSPVCAVGDHGGKAAEGFCATLFCVIARLR